MGAVGLCIAAFSLSAAEQPGEKIVFHQFFPPVHQWIAGEAYQMVRPDLPAAALVHFDAHVPERTVISVEGHSVPGYSEAYLVIQGSKEEDSADESECVNHFWDPDGGPEGGIPWFGEENAFQRSRRYWGEATNAWRSGDTNLAFYKLGRIAHLLTDMSVPAHVHNDQHLWRDSFETYMTEYNHHCANAYNYHQWSHVGLAPAVGASLYDLFHAVAEIADQYESDDADGEDPAHQEDHNGAWETQKGVPGYYDTSYAECRAHGNALVPLAMRYVAGLYKLFWDAVAPPPAMPTAVSASDGNPTNAIRVTWSPVAGASAYHVFRSATPTGTATWISGVLTTNAFDDQSMERGQVYYYSVRAANASNHSARSGADSGSTPPAPPWFLAASFGSYTDRIAVTWNAMPNATHYQLYRATESNGTRAVVMSWNAATEFVDFNVTSMQSYCYWVRSRGPCGDSEFSAMAEGWMRGQPPPPPAWVSASDGAHTDRVAVCWSPAPGATGYRLYRATSATGTLTEITSWWQNVTNYDDTTGLAGTTYYYRVRANGDWGASDYSACDTGWKRPPPPPAPTGLTASDGAYTERVEVAWNAAPGATEYKLYRANSYDGEKLELTDWRAALTYADYAVVAGVERYYWVRARGPWGESGYSDYDWGYAAVAPPEAPYNVRATQNEFADCVVVAWDSASFGQPWNERYRLYRGTSPTGAMALVRDWDPTPSFWDYGVGPCTAYYYRAQTTNCWGLSPLSDAAAGWRESRPARPTGLRASDAVYTDRIDVAWSPSALATSYRVYRSDSTSSMQAVSGWIAATNFTDTGLAPDRFFVYAVQAANAWGLSETSNPTVGRTRGIPPDPPADVAASDGTYGDRVLVTWGEPTWWDGHRVFRSLSPTNAGTALCDWIDYNPGAWGDTTAEAGVLYYYRVQPRSIWGEGALSAPDSGWRGTRPPATAAPVFSPPGGIYTNATLLVTVTCGTTGAVLRYTTDGRDPEIGDPAVAAGGAVPLTDSCTLKARAWKDGQFPSPASAAAYVITRGNGRLLAAADEKGLIRLFGLETGEVLAEESNQAWHAARLDIADTDGDGALELIAVPHNDTHYPAECRDLLTLALRWQTEDAASYGVCGDECFRVRAKVCDVDLDGRSELALPLHRAGDPALVRVFSAGSGCRELEYRDRAMGPPVLYFDPADGRQKMLLVSAETGRLSSFDLSAGDGPPDWEADALEGARLGAVNRSLTDGLPRLWQGGANRAVVVYDRGGNELWHRSYDGGVASVVYGGCLEKGEPEALLVGGSYHADEARLTAVALTNGAVLWEFRDEEAYERLEVMAVEDLDGDGCKEVLALAFGNAAAGKQPRYVCLSGSGGKLHWAHPYAGDTHLLNLARLMDVDGDGVKDALVAAERDVELLDGRRGDTVARYRMTGLVTAFDLTTGFWDSDGDGLCDWQEQAAGSCPTNAASLLRISACERLPDGGFWFDWPSVSNRHYAVERATDLAAGFRVLVSGVPALPPTNRYTDTVRAAGRAFYRIRLSE